MTKSKPQPGNREAQPTPVPSKEHFVAAYSGQAPWDIPRPQPVLVASANEIVGSLLDCGCGTGENAIFFAALGNRVTGIGYLEEPIRRAKQKAAERNVAAEFLVLDALALEGLHRQFDNAIDSGLFHVFSDEDRRKYVAGLASVLRPGGRLYVLCFSDEEPGTQGPRRVTQQELHEAFSPGWSIESIEAARFAVRSDLKDISFSEGGPKAWFAIVRREG